MSDRSDYRLVNDPNTDEEKEQTNVQPPSTSNALDGFQDLDLMSTNVDAAAQEEKRAAQEKRKQERAERKRKSEAADAEDENPYKKFATNPEGYNEWTMEEKRLWNIQRNKAFDATFDDTKNMMKKSRKTRRKKLDVGIKTGPIRKSGRETKQPELFGVSRDTEGAEDVGITWFDKDDNDDWADGSDSGDNTDEEEDEYEYEPEELTLKPKTAQKAGKKEKKITYKEWVTEIEGLDIDDWMEILSASNNNARLVFRNRIKRLRQRVALLTSSTTFLQSWSQFSNPSSNAIWLVAERMATNTLHHSHLMVKQTDGELSANQLLKEDKFGSGHLTTKMLPHMQWRQHSSTTLFFNSH
jgi:hypothetical protein